MASLFQGFAIFIIRKCLQLSNWNSLLCRVSPLLTALFITNIANWLFLSPQKTSYIEGCCATYRLQTKQCQFFHFVLSGNFFRHPIFLISLLCTTYRKIFVSEWSLISESVKRGLVLLFPFNSESPNTETDGCCRLLCNVKLVRSLEKQIHCVWPYLSIWNELQQADSKNLVSNTDVT